MINDPIIRDIPGYEEMYQISENGIVYNMVSGKELKNIINGKGYYYVTLCKNGKKHLLIHRLLAIIFIKNPENKKCVDHVDRNKLNNDLSNLRWCNRSENGQNVKIKKNNSTGETGISHKKIRGRSSWLAQISFNGKIISKLFSFDDEGFQEAVIWRKYKEIILFKDFSPNYSKKDEILADAKPFLEKWNINMRASNTSGHKHISKIRNNWEVIINKIRKRFPYNPEGLSLAIKFRDSII